MQEDITKEIVDRAIRVAAASSEEGHSYLPQTETEHLNFKPHDWVRNAVIMAYKFGLHMAATGEASPKSSDDALDALLKVALGRSLYQELTEG